MAGRVVYVVRVRIAVEWEKDWNHWHDEEHIPKVLALPGFVQVHKYRSVSSSTTEAEYFVLYELRNHAAYQNYVQSEEGAKLRQEFLDAFGAKTKMTRWTWQETLHLVK